MRRRYQRVLTGGQADEVISEFVPLAKPDAFKDLKAWYAGHKFYRLWEGEDGARAIFCSDHADFSSAVFLVKSWKPGEQVGNDYVYRAIKDHSESLNKLITSHGVLKKIHAYDGAQDIYYSKQCAYVVDLVDGMATRIRASLFVGSNSHAKMRVPGMYIWKNKSGQSGRISRKDAELKICQHHIESHRRALTTKSNIDPDLKARNPLHYYGGVVFRRASQLPFLGGAERLDTGWAITENALSAAAAISNPLFLGWKIAAMAIELRAIARREKVMVWPGSVNSQDPLVKDLSDKSALAAPLGDFLRPVKPDILAKGKWHEGFYFDGQSGTRTFLPHDSFEAVDWQLRTNLGLTIDSTVRFYWDKKATPAYADYKKDIGAVKIYRPDGLTVTIFKGQTKIWISHAPERQIDKTGPLNVPAELLREIKPGMITELDTTDVSDGDFGKRRIRHLKPSEANAFFMDKFADGFTSMADAAVVVPAGIAP